MSNYHPSYRFLPKTGHSYVKFPTPEENPNVKIPTQGKARRVNFPWVARPPTLGLSIDRCIMTIILIKIISFDLDQCQRYLGEKTVKPSWPAPNLLLICTRKDWQFEIPTKQTRVITSVTWTAVTVLRQEQELPILRYLVGIRSRGEAWVSRAQRCEDWAEWESLSVIPIPCTLEYFLRKLIPQ